MNDLITYADRRIKSELCKEKMVSSFLDYSNSSFDLRFGL